MNKNRYNTKVRQAMSDKYVKSSQKKKELEDEWCLISQKLSNNETRNAMKYNEYCEMKQKAETIQREINRLSIEREVWDMARELCMDIADEEAKNEEDIIKVPMEYEYLKSTLKNLKDLAQSVRNNEDSVFADERGVAEYDTREIIDTLLNLEL